MDASDRAELVGLTLRQLKARARELGVDDDALDALDDADDPKAAAIGLVREATPAAAPSEDELRAELAALTLRQLKARAREAGAPGDTVDELDDVADPKAAAIDLVVSHTQLAELPLPSEAELRAQLGGLTLRQLKARAREAGAAGGAIDGLDDAADVKAAAIDLVVSRTAGSDRAIPEGIPKKPEPEPQSSLSRQYTSLERKVLVMSCPEEGTIDPYGGPPYDQKVMDKVEELQQRRGIKFGFDRAGTTTGVKEDESLFAEAAELATAGQADAAKAKIRETKWLYGYSTAAKALIKIESQGFGGVLEILCLEGGLITQVEAEEMQRIVNDAKKDAAKSHVKVRIQLRTMSYFDFVQEFDTEPQPGPQPELEHPAPEPEPEQATEPLEPYVRTRHVKKDEGPQGQILKLPMAERKFDFFINHCQKSGQDQCGKLADRLKAAGCRVWYDMNAEDLTEHGMEVGVSQSRNILMFLSQDLMGRPFCIKEQRWGIEYGCKFVGVMEKDDRHGKADFAKEKEKAPDDLKHLLDEVEFLDFQRREFQLQALIEELMRRGGCSAKAGPAVVHAEPEPATALEPVDDVFVAYRDGSAEQGRLLQDELLSPHGGLPAELPEQTKGLVALLPETEVELLKRPDDPMRQLLADVFRPGSRRIAMPVVGEDFNPEAFEGLPDDIRALARQQLVVLNGRESASATARIREFMDHARKAQLTPELRGFLDTLVADTELQGPMHAAGAADRDPVRAAAAAHAGAVVRHARGDIQAKRCQRPPHHAAPPQLRRVRRLRGPHGAGRGRGRTQYLGE
eukprot:COSAG04_NODE_458_length_14025_cov_349.233735_2_plen_799_part_00